MSDVSMMNSRSSSDHCRTVVVSGVPDMLSGSRMNDKLTIHFQSARSHGGDVEMVQYPTHLEGVAFVTFDNWRDADRVVEFNQVLKDREFKEEHPLTVYTYTPEVAFYAYADLDLSLYPDPSTLIATLKSNHRSVRIQPSPTKPGFVSAEGPFSALQELRKYLLSLAQNQIDTLDEALSPYKALSLDKTLISDKARILDKASMPYKALSSDRVSSPDLAWTQGEALRLYKTSSQDKASSDKSWSLDKTLGSYKTWTQEEAPIKASSQDKTWTQVEALRLYKTSSEDKASSDKTWTQEQASGSNLVTFSNPDLAWTQKEASGSYAASSQDKKLRSYKFSSQDKTSSPDMSWTQGEASGSYKTSSQDKALSFDKSWTQEQALGSNLDKACTQEETSGSYVASSKDKTLRLYKFSSQDKAWTQEEAQLYKTSSSEKSWNQGEASSFDESRSQDKAGQSKEDDDMNITHGTNCVKFWLDTHIYKYMQMVERSEWDRCVGKYNVSAQAVNAGEVTEVKLQGRCDGSVLLSAQTELEFLVAERQGNLRTQHIDCSTADAAAVKRLLQGCESVQRLYTDVCYFLSDSCIEVIGPSYSSHRFCEMVKRMSRNSDSAVI